MRRHKLLALPGLFGILLVVAGMVLLVGLPVMAQEDEEPQPDDFLASFYEAWGGSAHNAAETEAFVHWDEDGEVEQNCAQCHSTYGYLDFLGEDGSAFGTVDSAAPLGSTVNCDACHNDTASNLDAITFPSGIEIATDDNATRCMVCHQGRSSGMSVDNALAEAGVEDMNAVSEDLRFINIHYYAAAASLYGSDAGGGYEYAGQSYQLQNEHVPGYDTCTSCHDPHTLEIDIADCQSCHEDLDSTEDLRDIRMPGSIVDFDGDGDVREGLADEIEGLQAVTYAAIQTYASEVVGAPIVWGNGYPYFFNDLNADGIADEDEVNYGNQYNSWTGNLLMAAYNYQVSLKDPGAYAHNGVYAIQLLYDSAAALNGELAEPMDMSAYARNEAGHFDVTAEAFRHWDEDGEVSASCSRCHTDEGLPFLLDNGTTIAFEPSNSLSCQTCHDSLSEFTLYVVNEVTMPSGAVVSFGEEEASNVCLQCHQGRESGVSISNSIANAGVGDDEVSEDLHARNPHYFAAGATFFGADANGGYQYDGMDYSGQYDHSRRVNDCQGCHNVHSLENRVERCIDCHEEAETEDDVVLIRAHPDDATPVDYDGDGDLEEPIRDEMITFEETLYAGIQAYANDVIGQAIVYEAHSYPYWFLDTNGDGVANPDEANYGNQYPSWTPTLLRAAYNYQYALKDPGAFAHNADYVLQLLYDSIADISGEEAVATFTRPEAVPTAMDDE